MPPDKKRKSESQFAIYAAIAGNVAIAITKFVAAAFTGSAAILSQAIHSVVYTGHVGLTLLGVRKSRKLAAGTHRGAEWHMATRSCSSDAAKLDIPKRLGFRGDAKGELVIRVPCARYGSASIANHLSTSISFTKSCRNSDLSTSLTVARRRSRRGSGVSQPENVRTIFFFAEVNTILDIVNPSRNVTQLRKDVT